MDNEDENRKAPVAEYQIFVRNSLWWRKRVGLLKAI